MDAPLTMHLTWEAPRAAEAKRAVEELFAADGWEFLLEAVQARADHLVDALACEDPTDSGAVYAAKLAEIRAWRQFPDLVEGIVQLGREAEAELRELEPVA